MEPVLRHQGYGERFKTVPYEDHVDTRTVARAVILVAIGVAISPFTSIPIGIARINPTQHFINVVAAVLLGPWWASGIALVIGILRNALGTGTLLAFPGGMIGAFLAGYTYRLTRNIYLGAVGEIIGTGFFGAVASVLIVAPMFMKKTMALAGLMMAFSGSTILGSILGILALRLLERAGFFNRGPNAT
jgi:energy-coupling factor transport system ATP-binding protein